MEEEEADDREKDETAKLIKILMNLDHIESFSLTCYPQGFKVSCINHYQALFQLSTQIPNEGILGQNRCDSRNHKISKSVKPINGVENSCKS